MSLAGITEPLFFFVTIINALLGIAAIVVLVSYMTKPPFHAVLKKHFSKHGLKYGFVVALLATLGSLWLSEIYGVAPCKLCWYQRIAMYPLVVVLGVGIFKKGQERLSGLILASTGAVIAGYHYLVQRANFWQVADMNGLQLAVSNFFSFIGLDLQAPSCAADASCSSMYLGYGGFYSIPLLAFVSFIVIIVVLWAYKKR